MPIITFFSFFVKSLIPEYIFCEIFFKKLIFYPFSYMKKYKK